MRARFSYFIIFFSIALFHSTQIDFSENIQEAFEHSIANCSLYSIRFHLCVASKKNDLWKHNQIINSIQIIIHNGNLKWLNQLLLLFKVAHQRNSTWVAFFTHSLSLTLYFCNLYHSKKKIVTENISSRSHLNVTQSKCIEEKTVAMVVFISGIREFLKAFSQDISHKIKCFS